MRHMTPLVLLTLAACGRDKPADTVIIADSAGVHIVTNRTPLWTEGAGWHLGGAPTLQIGGGVADTSLLVGPVAGAFRLADGRVLVADEGTMSLRWFGADGKLLQAKGRKGDGPGEYRQFSETLEVGDSIAIYDGQLRRLTLLDREGNVGRTVTVAQDLEPIGRLPDGNWVAWLGTSHRTGEQTGPVRDTAWLWTVDSDGKAIARIATLRGSDVLVAASDRFVAVIPPPFGRETTIRFHDGSLWVGTADAFRLDRLSPSGTEVASVRWDRIPEILADADGRAAKDSMVKGFSAGRAADDIVRAVSGALDKFPLPGFKPPYSTFRVADDGALWVERFVTSDHTGPTDWVVFRADGRMLGDVTLPPGFEPTQIADHEILGIWKDPDGVDHVVAYPLEKPATS